MLIPIRISLFLAIKQQQPDCVFTIGAKQGDPGYNFYIKYI